MAIYVLVPGAWHASWCWERIVPLLQDLGHQVETPDLMGLGFDGTPIVESHLAAWADQIAEIVQCQTEPVVLVGHSRGRLVISEVAERVPERIKRLVYLSAFLLSSGETLLDAAGKSPTQHAPDMLILRDDGTGMVRSDAIAPIFYNRTEPAWIARAQMLMGPEPMASFSRPLKLTDLSYGQVKRAYIECTNDMAIPLALQRRMQAALPCEPVFSIDTDHSPFYSSPVELVECLAQCA